MIELKTLWENERRKAFENLVGKGENAGNQHFLLFPQCFKKASFSGLFKVPIAANWKGVCLQNTSKPHSYHLKMVIIMTSWIGDGAIVESSSQWQLKEF